MKRTTSKSRSRPQEVEREILLEADVMVDSFNRKIYIYRGEEDRLAEIVNSFC